MISNNFTEAQMKEGTVDIEYTAELTDDGKQIYVTASGF
jgi:hypothetical protein